jgi:hypothetical protein
VNKSSNNWVVAIVVLILVAATFYFGYTMRGVWNPAPNISDTVIVHHYDTITHHIISEVPYYISKTDTIIVRDTLPAKVDTAFILQNYYSWHHYTRVWQDSLLKVTLADVISENKIYDSDFNYQILKAQTVINQVNNSYFYNKSLYLGGSIVLPDAKWSSMAVFFASKRSLLGIGYIPYQKGMSLTGAFKLVSFK